MNKVIFEGGGDYPANEFIIGSGKNALLCRYQAEKQILSNTDKLTIEWAGTFKHYHSAMFRTIPIGKVHSNHYKMHEACIEALRTNDSIEKIIEITSSEENPKTNMSKAIKAFSI